MVEKDERDTSLSLSFIEEYRRYRSALHEREREIYRAINAAWAEYQIGNDEQLYRDNVARFVSSFSSLGVVMASYRAKPLGTELMAAERLAGVRS